MSKRTAILSVYDKTNVLALAKALVDADVEILSTGGTYKYLLENKIPVISISDYTGSPEILEGRVKSLHPKIHGGILARRDREDDKQDLASLGIAPIDFVIVNLYPFIAQIQKAHAEGNLDSLVEYIDVGGPTMLRAAAKNCRFVVSVCDAQDYSRIITCLTEGDFSLAFRQELAAKAFFTLSDYDAHVAQYFSQGERVIGEDADKFSRYEAIHLEKTMGLRYGENPHQQAALYRPWGNRDVPIWEQLQGKELSYNNLVDTAAAVDLLLEFYSAKQSENSCVIIKHTNPCGAATRIHPLDAFIAARDCDPVSAFGGIVAFTGALDTPLAEEIVKGFVEVIACERVEAEALSVLQKKKNIRLLKVDYLRLKQTKEGVNSEIKKCLDGYLRQSSDNYTAAVLASHLVAGDEGLVNSDLLAEINFAWKLSKHVKSNAIVVTKNNQLIGVGAGQMNRVDSARISITRLQSNGFTVQGAVAASDAFLPFPDTLEVLSAAGVRALVQPGGSIRDEEVINCAKEKGVLMFFTGERHFRH
ncbi:MAG: bifunctional phosphoribosylaminoimidazolecarboxamide formyltransferase/IMP cyclohydrolase [Deltaproteobacteria bacterium]|nr:bifunctional phosphoribosylaminoimidazolecarboxamide formyltransferase/IMP cyclohydrolase [Deltaproteobacteria bacterium]